METTAVLLQGDDLRKIIRDEVRSALSAVSRTIPPPYIQQEGGIDFAMEVLQVYSKSTIYKLTSEGRIPCTRRGKTLWFYRANLEKWLENGATNQRT